MNLKLNGLMYVNGAEVFCENLFVETDEDEMEFELDEDFDCGLEGSLIEDFETLSDILGFEYEEECDEYIDVDAMIEDYTEALLEGDMRPDCIGDLLESFAIELLGEEVEYDDEEFYY